MNLTLTDRPDRTEVTKTQLSLSSLIKAVGTGMRAIKARRMEIRAVPLEGNLPTGNLSNL